MPPANPACIQRAETIRRKAQHYTNLSEQTGKQCNDRHRASQQREQAEREMAALRAEAVQARRLASHIENLHQPANVQQKGRIMSSTISDPGHAQRMTRRETDTPHSTGSQLSFNPLHPSMELPPEHLIRLLGLENKPKRRKKRPASTATPSVKQKSAGPATKDKPVKLSLPATPPASAEREKDMASTPFDEKPRRNLVVASLAAGVVAGIGLSLYLFWGNPGEVTVTATQKTPPHRTEKSLHPSPATNKAMKPAMVPPAAASSAAPPVKAPTVAATPAITEAAPATVESSVQGTVIRENLLPQADIEIEQARLRDEAENRFAERMLQEEIRHDREVLTTSPASASVVSPELASEPAETLARDPVPASAPELQSPAPAVTVIEATPKAEPLKDDVMLSPVQEPAAIPVNTDLEQTTDDAATQEPAYQQPVTPSPEEEASTVDNGNPGEALF